MHFGLNRTRPIPACVWVMILVLLNPVMALGQDYRALSLDECLALARPRAGKCAVHDLPCRRRG